MKKLFLFFAIVAYAGVAVYSLTQMKPPLSLAQAQANAALPTAQYKLFTSSQEVLMKFYSDVFGTDWQAVANGYQGEVLNVTVLIAETKKRPRRTILQLQTDDLETLVTRIIDAGSNVKARTGGAAKSFVANDPDGNVIVLTEAAN
jgi:predicted enzyme related to lactoylglutathione lyase